MSHKNQKTIALLGEESQAKKNLAKFILGKEPTVDAQGRLENCENDRFRIVDPRKGITNPDLSLFVANNQKSKHDILKQLVQLKTSNKNPIHVLIPLDYLASLMGDPTEDSTRHYTRGHGNESRRGTRDINLILLGQTGTGKSACGNTILGKTEHFQSDISSTMVTKTCQKGEVDMGGTRVTVIDSPDYLYEGDVQMQKKLVRGCKDLLVQGGDCVYLLVMQLGRFTDGERDVLDNLEIAFDQPIRQKTIIVFTHGERLKREKTSFDEYLSDNVRLKNIIEQCGNRYHVFDNRKSDRKQVTELMQSVFALSGYSQEREDNTYSDKCAVC